MDWSKAKSVLIIAFVITNIFLLHAISENNNVYDSYHIVEDHFSNDVKSRLLEKGIKIDVDIPQNIQSLPLLNIEYEIYNNSREIVSNFLGEFKQDIIDLNVYYNEKGEKFIIRDNKKIIYENNNSEKKYDELNMETAKNLTHEFLDNKKIETDDYALNDFKIKDNRYFLEYKKIHNGLPIETSYMKFEIDNTGIKRFERQWIKSIEIINQEHILLNTATEALLKLLLDKENYNKTIVGIELCYYFDMQKQGSSDWSNIVKSDVIPTWRINFDDGTKKFLEEY